MEKTYDFPEITLLITHYNRSHSLENLLKNYQRLNCRFGDIVVSDDSSADVHLANLKKLQDRFPFRIITTPKNKGLGNNINKGQDAVTTPYTLYVQEDFEPAPEFPERLAESVNIMAERPDIDIVRYYAYLRYPYLKPFNDHFSEMYFPAWATNYNKLHYYSDHPHLRRSTFLNRFGRYVEGIKSDKTEYLMCVSFLQNKGKGLFYNDYRNLFHQKNSQEEPSTVSRKNWSTTGNPLIAFVRYFYRQMKFNYDIYLRKV
ncbi:glycosyltransferase [Spirosoma sp. KNUC1025]|uniref:glycosyltransferase n=1 Tax=Spirosoma sp. KNUC1025 TaxID=2894082 RepID=UPI003868FEC6|nr:glycosyltransferase [Spirosoma sp. KNUC1025]